MEYSNPQKKEMQRLANLQPSLQDHGSKAFRPDGSLKNGYFQLRNHKVVKVSELRRISNVVSIKLEAFAETHKKALKNMKGIAYDGEGQLRDNFIELKSGKVIHKKHISKIDPNFIID